MAFLQTDTAAQSALAQQFGDTVTAARGTAAAFLEEVQALQGRVGGCSAATSADGGQRPTNLRSTPLGPAQPQLSCLAL